MTSTRSETSVSGSRSRFLLIFGVVWPVFTLLLEWSTGACASQFFDPLPTVLHGLLIAGVPWICWIAHTRERGAIALTWQRAVLGAAWAVASFYLLCFFVLTPLAWMGVVFSPVLVAAGGTVWVGLLPWATLGPFWAWLALWKARSRLRPAPSASGWGRQAPWLGALGALTLLLALEAPFWITRHAVSQHHMASDRNKAEWLDRLRRLNSEAFLRRLAYGNGHAKGSPLEWMASGGTRLPLRDFVNSLPDTEEARTLYYRVQGRAFSDLPPPKRFAPFDWETGRRDGDPLAEGLDWDEARAGDAVGARLRGLSLASSRMDWHLDAPSRLAYGEWTLSFANSRVTAQEARCQILLPAGGFVSRLTLWVNGEPREAAFSTQAKVKAAYQQVVVREQRDPVLVNVAGPDRVLCQCFPGPPKGSIQIRLGITAPLSEHGLEMPDFIERNFAVPEELRHAVWMQSAHEFTSRDPQPVVREAGPFTWRQDLSPERLQALRFHLTQASPPPQAVWCEDPWPQEGRPRYFSGTWRTVPSSPPSRFIVVVDTSLSLRPWAGWMGPAVNRLADNAEVVVLASNDESWREVPLGEARKSWSNEAFAGGRDNGPTLMEALERARTSGAEILWIHGPQPVDLGSHLGLTQILERTSQPPVLHALALVQGPNRLLERLHRHLGVRATGRCADEKELLSRMAELSRQEPGQEFVVTRQATQPEGERVWDHLARFGVHQQVLAAWQEGLSDPAPLSLLAASYQLVTPLSGAVVLETQEQYQRTGLDPVDPNSTPQIPKVVVPEPSRLLLLAAALAALTLRRRR